MKRRKFIKNVSGVTPLVTLPIGFSSNKLNLADENQSKLPNWKILNAARILREGLYDDPYRPIFHFVSPEGQNHPFDPNGAIYWNEAYHMGYIFQHYDENGEKHHYWGHIKSHDLLHWTYLPTMLTVESGDPETGIYSGNAFLSREGIPHISYFGVGVGNCIAKAMDDDLLQWKKFNENPVVKSKGRLPKFSITLDNEDHAFDPHIWIEDNIYYQVSGGNPAALYKSNDLKQWKYVGQFLDQSKRMRHDFEDFACPDIFKLGNKTVAVGLSHNLGAFYYIGTFINEQFVPESFERMNWHGGSLFAPETLVDNNGRRILWGWVRETRPLDNTINWSGILSMPRIMSLSDNDKISISPPEEFKNLRYGELSFSNLDFKTKDEIVIASDYGRSVEISVEITYQDLEEFGIKVFCSLDGKEETVLKYCPKQELFIIDFSKSSKDFKKIPSHWEIYLDKSVPETVSHQETYVNAQDGILNLEIFLDRCVLEVFINRQKCMTQTLYPSIDSRGVKIYSKSSSVVFKKMNCWKMSKTNFV